MAVLMKFSAQYADERENGIISSEDLSLNRVPLISYTYIYTCANNKSYFLRPVYLYSIYTALDVRDLAARSANLSLHRALCISPCFDRLLHHL